MKIKAVLLDLDDTLWPVRPLLLHAEAALYEWIQVHVPHVAAAYSIEALRAKRQGLIASDPRFRYDLWALRHTVLSQVFVEHGEVAAKADLAMAVFAHARNQVSLYADVEPGLTQLAQHVKLGTISNGFADLQAIGLARHFQVSLAAHQFGCAKPDTRIFHAACAALALAPAEVLYVGDDLLLDVEGAQRAGLPAAWMNRSGIVSQERAHPQIRPELECRDLYDLLQLF